MAQKASAPAKKAVAAKPVAKKRVSKGEAVACEVCGLSVVVEEVGGIAVSEETTLICCGKPMKSRKDKAAARDANPMKRRSLSGEPLTQAAGASGLAPDPKENVKQQ